METELHRLIVAVELGKTVRIGNADVKIHKIEGRIVRLCILAPLSVVVVREAAKNKHPNPKRTL